jgi:hypothetical protein
MRDQECDLCGRPIGDGDYVSGHRTCSVCRRGGTIQSLRSTVAWAKATGNGHVRREAEAKLDRLTSRLADEAVRCVRCGTPLTEDDPAVTTLGPRCRRCW